MLYIKFWFLSPSLEDAAFNDHELFASLQKFEKIPGALSKKVTQKTTEILLRHTWYCSEELIPIALFSDKVSDESTRKREKILSSGVNLNPAKLKSLKNP